MKINKLFSVVVIFGFLAVATSALAYEDYKPLVQIPRVVNTGNFLQYLSGIYNFLISIVGILAMAALVYGGFRYLTSVGNPAAVEDAKDIINSAIIGLVLALSSWLILNEINPDVLVTSRKPGITGATDKYAYNQTPEKCIGSPSSAKSDAFSTIPYSETNPATYCTCIDQKTIPKKTKKAKLTLSVTNSTLVGSFINISGKLTDADTNAGISGNIKIKAISDTLGGMKTDPDEPSADSSGNYSYNTDALTSCIGTFNVQAVFDGDTTYTSAGSDVKQITVTTGGGFSTCASSDFPIKPAAYWKADTCDSLCGDKNKSPDGQYHCINARLGVGITQGDALGGNQMLISPPVKKNQPIYFDAISNVRGPVAKIEVDTNVDWANWIIGADYTCVFDSACGTVASCSYRLCKTVGPCLDSQEDDKPWPAPMDIKGRFIHSYVPGTYQTVLRVYVKDPTSGTCLEVAKDRGVIIEVVP